MKQALGNKYMSHCFGCKVSKYILHFKAFNSLMLIFNIILFCFCKNICNFATHLSEYNITT